MRWAFADSWRADSPCLRMARSRNYPMCENSSAGRVRRISRRNCVSRESNLAAYIWPDAVQENSIFHMSLMYEFLHSQGHELKGSQRADQSASPSECVAKLFS